MSDENTGWGFKPESLGKAAELVDLPPDAMAEYGITVISYLDADGEAMFGFQTHGDRSMTALVGLLTMTIHRLAHLANPTPCEDDE